MEPLRAEGGEAAGGGPLWTAVFEYEACGEDELSLRPGDVVQVLSRDSQVSGDEGWWTGKIDQRVGIFPSNYVSSGVQGAGPELRARYPPPPAIQRKEDGHRGGGTRVALTSRGGSGEAPAWPRWEPGSSPVGEGPALFPPLRRPSVLQARRSLRGGQSWIPVVAFCWCRELFLFVKRCVSRGW